MTSEQPEQDLPSQSESGEQSGSESNEPAESSEPSESDREAMAEGHIPDSQLPEDLRPDKNPLAAPPEDGEGEDSEDGNPATDDNASEPTG